MGCLVRTRLRTRAPEASPIELLAQRLDELDAERDSSAADAERSEASREERLRDVDGAEALHEITSDEAARLRGDVAAEHDSIVARADSARRAREHVLERLIAAAEAEAAELKVEPLAAYRSAVAARDEAAAVLAEREDDVALKREGYDEAEKAARAVLVEYVPAERERDRVERNRRSTAVAWAVRQPGNMGLAQLAPEHRDEAREAIEARNAAARREPVASVDGSIPAHEEWPRLGAA